MQALHLFINIQLLWTLIPVGVVCSLGVVGSVAVEQADDLIDVHASGKIVLHVDMIVAVVVDVAVLPDLHAVALEHFIIQRLICLGKLAGHLLVEVDAGLRGRVDLLRLRGGEEVQDLFAERLILAGCGHDNGAGHGGSSHTAGE